MAPARHPPSARGGIGSALLDTASAHVDGAWTAGLGSGYWWQGVPEGCGDDFLARRGFEWSWTSVDMLLDLAGWAPEHVSGHAIGYLEPHDAPELLAMLSGEPDLVAWSGHYAGMIDDARHHLILVCRLDGDIAGCAMALGEDDIRWSTAFPGRTGGIGCLGVMGRYRGKGIGLALATAVTRELQALGYDHSYVGYTWLEDWYGRLGYRTVYGFRMGRRTADHQGTR